MPYCTECGARHDERAKVCPSCGEPIVEAPMEDDLEDAVQDVVASLGGDVALGDELPDFPDESESLPDSDAPVESTSELEYVERIDEARQTIAAQSSALRELDHLSWSDSGTIEVRNQLDAAIAKLDELRPPAELSSAHEDFMQGAQLLAEGFQKLVDASGQSDPQLARAEAEETIAEATAHFVGGAQALELHMSRSSNLEGLGGDDDTEEDWTTLGEGSVDDLLADFSPGQELAAEDRPDETAAAPADLPEVAPPASPDPSRRSGEAEDETPAVTARRDVERDGESPKWRLLPDEEAALASEVQAGAWPRLGDAATDSLLVEIEGGWVRARPNVHEALERAIRGAVADSLRGAMNTRVRVEQEARMTLDRIASERKRLTEEVEALRREAHALQTELSEQRQALNELERERQIAQERRQQIFQDAETHRSQLLREIEQLGSQLEAMRRNLVSLLNMSGTDLSVAGEAAPPAPPRPPVEPPRAPTVRPTARSAESTPDRATTEVRISGVTSLAQNMQIQRALKALPGVAVEGQPRFRAGILTATLSHGVDIDLEAALGSLPEAPLTPRGAPQPNVLEFAAA